MNAHVRTMMEDLNNQLLTMIFSDVTHSVRTRRYMYETCSVLLTEKIIMERDESQDKH